MKLWDELELGQHSISLMNLDHPDVEVRIIEEMSQGVDVYYDRRWEVTDVLTQWIAEHPDEFKGKDILIVGAGVGAESVMLGVHAKHLWINDLAPVALELCGEQLEKNGIQHYTPLLGRYEEVNFPKVDLIVASFLVYNRQTLDSILRFKEKQNCAFILMNEMLKEFKVLLKQTEHTVLFETDGAVCVKF